MGLVGAPCGSCPCHSLLYAPMAAGAEVAVFPVHFRGLWRDSGTRVQMRAISKAIKRPNPSLRNTLYAEDSGMDSKKFAMSSLTSQRASQCRIAASLSLLSGANATLASWGFTCERMLVLIHRCTLMSCGVGTQISRVRTAPSGPGRLRIRNVS
ncbi:hypothetical protein D3C71_1360750 [compost metagenome]